MRARSLARTLLSLFPILLVARTANAQGDELRPGVRVRLTAPGIVAGQLSATVVARSADSITVASDHVAPLTVALGRITALEVSRGNSRSAGAARGVLWSLPVGIGLGVAAEAQARRCTTCRGEENVSPFQAVLIGTAFWGAGIGALVGRERWESFSLERTLSVTSSRGGPALGVHWTF